MYVCMCYRQKNQKTNKIHSRMIQPKQTALNAVNGIQMFNYAKKTEWKHIASPNSIWKIQITYVCRRTFRKISNTAKLIKTKV